MRLTTVTVAAAACLAAVIAAAPAGAAAPRAAKDTSTYLAGYQTTQIGISRASATLTVPTVTCDPTATSGIHFGIGNEPSISQLSLLVGVRITCSNGTPSYSAYALGTATRQIVILPVAAGDRFSILISQTQRSLTASATDLTSGAVAKVTGAPKPDNTLTFGAFALEGGVTPFPVPDFGSVTIGKPVLENTGLAAWSPTRLTRANAGVTQIATGAFQTNGGFRVIYKAS